MRPVLEGIATPDFSDRGRNNGFALISAVCLPWDYRMTSEISVGGARLDEPHDCNISTLSHRDITKVVSIDAECSDQSNGVDCIRIGRCVVKLSSKKVVS